MSDLTDITDNIETVLSATLGYKLEDLSSVGTSDEDWDDAVLCQLLWVGHDEQEVNLNNEPKWTLTKYIIEIQIRDVTPDLSRSRSQEIHDNLRSNLTVSAIDLTAQNVQLVIYDETDVSFEPPLTKITYPIRVRYGYTGS